MKILVAVVAFSFIISGAVSDMNAEAVADDDIKKCFAGINKEEALRAKTFEPADWSPKMRCALKCLLDKFNLTDAITGEFLPKEVRYELISPGTEDDQIIEGCKISEGDNACDTTFMTVHCLVNAVKNETSTINDDKADDITKCFAGINKEEALRAKTFEPADWSPKMRCAFKCLLDKTNLTDAITGEFLPKEVRYELISPGSEDDKIIEGCKISEGDNACDTTFMTVHCLVNAVKNETSNINDDKADDITKCFAGINKEEALRAKTFEPADWSPKMRCAFKCLLDKANLTDAITGEFLPKEVRYELISPGSEDDKIIEGCKISEGDNACDTTFMTVHCLVNAVKNETSNINDDKADDITKCFAGINKEEALRAKTFEPADWSPKMRCAFKCLLDKTNLTDAITGEFLPKEVRYELISPGSEDDKIIEGCKISEGDNACDTTFMTVHCLVNAVKNETSNINDDKADDITKCFAGINKEEALRAKTFEPADWSPKMRCAFKCLLDKTNLTDAITGEFLPKEVRYELISPGSEDDKIIEGCKISEGDNACDTTFMTVHCLVNAVKNETSNINDDKADDITKCFAGINKEEALRAKTFEPADWSPKMRCAFKCLLDKANFTDAITGEFLPKEVRYELISPGSEDDKIIEGCKISEGDNACDTTFMTVHCLVNAVKNETSNINDDKADDITKCFAGINKEEALRAKTFEPADWSPKMRCAFKCLLDKANLTDAITGEFLPKEVRYELISPGSEDDKIIEGCKISEGDNACDTTFMTVHCLVNAVKNETSNINDDKADDITKCFAGINKEEALRAKTFEPADWSPKMRCAFKCLLDKANLTDAITGEFLPKEVRYELISPGSEDDKIIEGCKISEGDNACDTTFMTVHCLVNAVQNETSNINDDKADDITKCFAGINKEEALRAKTFEPADWSPQMRCVFKCLLDKLKLTDAITGEFLPKEVKYQMISPGTEYDKMIEECKVSKGDNECDTTFLTVHCIMNAESKLFNNSYDIADHLMTCFAGLNKEEVLRAETFEPADWSPKMRCAFKCLLDKLKISDAVTGELLPKEVRYLMISPGSEHDKMIEGCKISSVDNACDTTFLSAHCLVNAEEKKQINNN